MGGRDLRQVGMWVGGRGDGNLEKGSGYVGG